MVVLVVALVCWLVDNEFESLFRDSFAEFSGLELEIGGEFRGGLSCLGDIAKLKRICLSL